MRLIAALLITLLMASPVMAGSVLQQSSMTYLGAFRVPQGTYGDADVGVPSLQYGGAALTYNPANNSLIMIGQQASTRMAIEISIPAAVNSGALADLNTATVIQPSKALAGNNKSLIGLINKSTVTGPVIGSAMTNKTVDGGFLVYDGKLIGSMFGNYDAGSTGTAARGFLSHYTANLDWSSSAGFDGFYELGTSPVGAAEPNGGFVGGYMATIPTEWQTALGGPVLTGLGGVSIQGRSSLGPGAWVFNPANLVSASTNPVSATMLLGYPETQAGNAPVYISFDGPSLFYNGSTRIRGAAFPSGSDTVLFFGIYGAGITGNGEQCYGTGQDVEALHNTYTSGATSDTSTTSNTLTAGPKTFTVTTSGNPLIYAGVKVKAINADNPGEYMLGTVAAYSGTTVTTSSITDLTPTGSTVSNWVLQFGTGDLLCYDPTDHNHGTHSYPYGFMVYAYYASDLAAVKAGTKQPWEIAPYAQWPLSFAVPTNSTIGSAWESRPFGVAYDQSTQRIYVSRPMHDNPGSSRLPLIEVFQLSLGESPIPGSCGSSNGLSLSSAPVSGLCTAGTPSAVSGTGPWSWTCAGSGGGGTANCGATLLEIPSGGASAVVACPVMAGFR